MNFINYLIHYKENSKELEDLTKKYDDERADTYKANERIQELKEQIKFLTERNDKYLDTIKSKNKEIRELKKRNKKLQQIEAMFENKKVVLRDLKELVRGE